MAKTAITFGVLLILLGIIGYIATGSTAVTALIPAFFGFSITILGAVALNAGARKHAMHIAAAVATIGFVGAALMVIKTLVKWMSGSEVQRPVAFAMQVIMLILLGVFVALCVRSFIEARRNRRGFDVVGTDRP